MGGAEGQMGWRVGVWEEVGKVGGERSGAPTLPELGGGEIGGGGVC